MPLTPQEVASKVFGPTRMRRGYDENEVDAFLDTVEAELTRLTTENERLRRELENAGHAAPDDDPNGPSTVAPAAADTSSVLLQKALPDASSGPAAPVVDVPVEQQVARMLVLAQQTADAAINEAQSEADKTRGAARIEADRLLTEARARAAEEIGTLERSKSALEGEVERLHAFEREYRSRLRAYLSLQLHELEGDTVGPAQVEASDRHVLDVADPSENGQSGKSGNADRAVAPSIGLQEPPGFGPVWSPGSSPAESYPGLDPLINGPREPQAHHSSLDDEVQAQRVGYGSAF